MIKIGLCAQFRARLAGESGGGAEILVLVGCSTALSANEVRLIDK
jgi:hypothetical protein